MLNPNMRASEILTASFATNKFHDEPIEKDGIKQETHVQILSKLLGLSTRYQIARLAIGTSLGIENQFEFDIKKLQSSISRYPIKGDILFGTKNEHYLLWLGLILQHYQKFCQKPNELNLHGFQMLVHFHWTRGLDILWDIYQTSNDDVREFMNQLVQKNNTSITQGAV